METQVLQKKPGIKADFASLGFSSIFYHQFVVGHQNKKQNQKNKQKTKTEKQTEGKKNQKSKKYKKQ